VILSKPVAHRDPRGRFTEIMRAAHFPETFVQSNHSRSQQGVLRGLHYHRHQADLWYVVSGKAQVGLADLRELRNPPLVATVVLDGDEPQTLYIPAGVAHGFLAVTDVDLIYFVSAYYDATDEHGVAWDDPTLAIPWEISDPVLSGRDAENPRLSWEDIPSFS
jgi:dTDP-4-dehydrorhamnose 3,5-epimerase